MLQMGLLVLGLLVTAWTDVFALQKAKPQKDFAELSARKSLVDYGRRFLRGDASSRSN